ncbi:MAG: hypothetical protein AB1393_08475 [Candidatus Edwardsbacteria bacterium]
MSIRQRNFLNIITALLFFSFVLSNCRSAKKPLEPSSAPTLVEPADGDTLKSPEVTFIWNAVSNADHYEIEVGKSVNFASTTLIVDKTDIKGTSYSYNFLSESINGPETLYWRVGAFGGACVFGKWSNVRSFFLPKFIGIRRISKFLDSAASK